MSGDWIKTLLPAISSLMCILTFLVVLCKGELRKISIFDFVAVCAGVVAAFMWWHKSATHGNMWAQVCVFIGFVPTYLGVWKNPKNEKPLPWFIWSLAYAVGTVVVLLRLNNQYFDIVYYANCVVLHLLVVPLALRKDKFVLKWIPFNRLVDDNDRLKPCPICENNTVVVKVFGPVLYGDAECKTCGHVFVPCRNLLRKGFNVMSEFGRESQRQKEFLES